jgi:NADH:ubiquinone oxidoreductase subunit F (NADH-binding)
MAVTWKKLAYFDEVATTFLALSDTPADYTDDGLKILRVNTGADAVEFVTAATVAAQMALDDIGDPDAAVGMAGQQLTDHVIHTVASATARLALTPVVGKLVWQTDETHPYVCTIAS